MTVQAEQEAVMANATASRFDRRSGRPEPRRGPGARVPERHRQDRAAQRRRRGRAGQAHRGRACTRSICSDTKKRLGDSRKRELRGRGPRRRGRPPAPAGGEPAPRGLAGQALHRSRHAAARPDPGGQPRPDPRDGEVRLRQGIQVLHLRDVVDPPGHHPRHGRPEPHHPAARPPGRAGQQAGADQARDAPEPRAARPPTRNWPKSPASRPRRSPTCSTTAATR